jgi:hypothetical protein
LRLPPSRGRCRSARCQPERRAEFPVADLLRERGIPFLFATGYAEGGVGWNGKAIVIAKPYGRDQLARALEELLG